VELSVAKSQMMYEEAVEMLSVKWFFCGIATESATFNTSLRHKQYRQQHNVVVYGIYGYF